MHLAIQTVIRGCNNVYERGTYSSPTVYGSNAHREATLTLSHLSADQAFGLIKGLLSFFL